MNCSLFGFCTEPGETWFLSEGESISVTSPDYPSPAPNSLFSTFVLRTNSSGFQITPQDLSLDYDDSLSIGEGSDPFFRTNTIVELFSYNSTRRSFVIPSQEMWIRFVTPAYQSGPVNPWTGVSGFTTFALDVVSIDTTGKNFTFYLTFLYFSG